MLINRSVSENPPLIPDVGIVGFVPEEWGGLWMPRHHVLTRLAKYFHVVWAEPARGWREHWMPGASSGGLSLENVECPPNFIRYHPGRWLPEVYRPAALGKWIADQRVRHAKTLLSRQGCRKSVFYLWRPDFAYALDAASCDLSCYHIDDEYSFSTLEQPLDRVEVTLIKRVDQVFIHSPALLDKKGLLNPKTLYVPNGVEYAAFSTAHEEPDDLRSIPHPRIGYVGHIKTQLDLELLRDLASAHPKWSFVLVGPKRYQREDEPFGEQLAVLPNVFFLGFKSVHTVCAYPQHMDVCILPYKLNDYTKYIYPLKLHEYLAAGVPVVGRPIRSLMEFGHAIKLATTVEEWTTAVNESLSYSEQSTEKLERRRNIARQFDWDTLVERIAKSICEGLGYTLRKSASAGAAEARSAG